MTGGHTRESGDLENRWNVVPHFLVLDPVPVTIIVKG
jgi:hypothetical protein